MIRQDDKFNKIKDIVTFCEKNVPYYRIKLKNAKIKSLQDFKKIPLVSKEVYNLNTPPKNYNMLSGKDSNCFLFSTGGTTSNPKYILRDYKDINEQYLEYSGLNVNENDTVINLFMPGIWGIFTTANLTLMKFGCKIIPYGGTNLNKENCKTILKLMREFKVNFLIGVPSTIISIISYLKLEKEFSVLRRVEKIFFLGEMITESMVKYLKDAMPNIKIKSKYGLMESAGIGYQCRYLEGNNYHIFPDRYVEIIKSGEKEKKGLIAVTTLNHRLIPLLRYMTGDLGIISDKRCKCGEETVLQVLGRNDDEVIFASIHLSVNLLSTVIKNFGQECSQIFQIVLLKKRGLDFIKIRIESESLMSLKQKLILIKKITKVIYKEIPDIIDAINSKKIAGFSINIVNPSSIKKIDSSGKVKKIIDLRK